MRQRFVKYKLIASKSKCREKRLYAYADADVDLTAAWLVIFIFFISDADSTNLSFLPHTESARVTISAPTGHNTM